MILNRRSYLLALALLLVPGACTKSPAVAEEGYFGIRVSADTEILELTKAETVLDDADAASYILTLSREGESLWSHTYEEFTASGNYSKVQAGNYTLTAENVTPETAVKGRGCVRLEGTADFSVRGGRTTEVGLCCKCANAKASVEFDSQFNSSFESGALVTFSDGKRTLEMPSGHTEANAAYFNCGEDGVAIVDYNLDATPKGGKAGKYSGSFSFPKGKWSKVVFSSGSVGEISIRIYADTSLREVDEDGSMDPMI